MKKIIATMSMRMGLILISLSLSTPIFSQTQNMLTNGVNTKANQPTHASINESTNTSLNQFAFDIFKKITPPDQNIVFSPYSISSLLGFLLAGSAGNTQQQFLNLLHISKSNVNDVAKNISQLNANLYNNNKSTLQIANAFFADKNFTYNPNFLNLFKTAQFVNFDVVDFKTDPDGARDTMNKFVSDRTNGYIQDLFPEGSVSSTDVLVLVNAIYFKGLWNNQFDENDTTSREFITNNNSTIKVPTMHKNADYSYFENNDLQMLALPYENSTLTMYVVLPKDKGNLNKVENELLTADSLSSLQKQMQISNHLNVYLPKFKIKSVFNDLDQNIAQLGLHDAFDLTKANFSKLTNAKFAISKIIQQAVIEVDEKGTTAAAASAIMGVGSVEAEPKTFDANHPFFFIIYDSSSNIILFMGHVVNPAQ